MRREERLQNFLKWLQAEQYPHPPHPPIPFITISRQVAAGGQTLARLLVSRLNEIDPGDTPWSVWDRELVEKVATEEHIPQAMIDELEEHRAGSWLEQLLAGLSARPERQLPDFLDVYRRMAAIIRALARGGRAVLVGRGSVFVTEDIPGGIHVRLVAPVGYRVAAFAKERSLPVEQASLELHRIEREREEFYHRVFPRKPLAPEQFTITLNTAAVPEAAQVASILALIRTAEPQGADLPMNRASAVGTA